MTIYDQIEESLAKGRSSWTVRQVLGLLWRGEATLLIHDQGSCMFRLAGDRVEILHLWCKPWSEEFFAWCMLRIPQGREIVWDGRAGWSRFHRQRGIMQ